MATRKKNSSRRYSKKANKKVGRAMTEAKRGTLRSGRSGKKVKSRKQAIAIGLSEARREGAKVPSNRSKKSSGGRKKTASSGRSKKSSGGRKQSSSGGRKRTTTQGSTSRHQSSRRSKRS